MNRVTEALQQISDLHAPVRKVSNRKRKQLKKPWITNAIMTSIKKKQKFFKTHFLSGNQDKIRKYKLYSNKLNKVKELAKKNYFRAQFDLHKNNLKATWKLIGVLVNKMPNSGVTIKKLIYENKCYTDKASIAHQLNNYYINVGRNLADTLPRNDADPTHYITRSFQSSFMFRGICTQEVHDTIMNINLKKYTIGIPQLCIKLACNYISEALTLIFNESLCQGIVPDSLKVSKVTPVDKGGIPTDPSNFRPISTLSALMQVFEKLVYKQFINYIEKHDILFQFQFGF